jgi:pSer/pThr/pTyr-binding forkhead associated (FHA) protein
MTHSHSDHGHLVVSFNGTEVSQHPITAAGLFIGRSKQADICISLLGLSRHHTQVEVGVDGVVVIDLGSHNGTWVNNFRIEGRRVLRDGDVLNYFDYAVRFVVGAAAYATPVGAAARTVTHPTLAAVFVSIGNALSISDNDDDWRRAHSAAEKTINALARKLVGVDTSGWADQGFTAAALDL